MSRAVVAVVIGIAAVADPLGLIEPAVAVGVVVLILGGISEMSRLNPASRPESAIEEKQDVITPPVT